MAPLGEFATGLRRLPLQTDADPYPWLPATSRVLIPSLDIDAKIVTVGITAQGFMDTPPFAAGRFFSSPHAGARGNLVLSAHNDIDGALFQRLPEIEYYEYIRVMRGPAVFTYQVSFQTKVWEEGAPPEVRQENARFLLPTKNPVCTLITCVPLWVDTHRWIVRAVLVDVQLPQVPIARTTLFGSG